ncbi:MAG: hypothetical protein U0736_08040 [Gemmataceae bacterium]
MKIRLYCPVCETPGPVTLPAASATWTCPGCEHVVTLAAPAADPALPVCAACGNPELYRKKDFPHTLGMAILVGAFVTSTLTYWWYDKLLTWAILLGSAAFDGLLYLLVKDVVVCYRCHAEHRGVTPDPERHRPFELAVHERYRQEKIRQERLQRSSQ